MAVKKLTPPKIKSVKIKKAVVSKPPKGFPKYKK